LFIGIRHSFAERTLRKPAAGIVLNAADSSLSTSSTTVESMEMGGVLAAAALRQSQLPEKGRESSPYPDEWRSVLGIPALSMQKGK